MIEWLDKMKSQLDKAQDWEAIMLRLEFQAVLEVAMMQLALHLKDPHKQSDILALLEKINRLVWHNT